jgi:cysteine desulfurase
VTFLPVAPHGSPHAGRIEPDDVAAAIRPETGLVTIMLANNEIGTIQPLAEIAAICREKQVPLHTDAAQAVGKLPVDVEAMGIDLLSLSAHKIYGPKGIGALFVRRRGRQVRIEPQLAGGGHEQGLRSGTLNVPGIVGLAEALRLCDEEMPGEAERLAGLRNRLYHGLSAALGDVWLCGPSLQGGEARLPGNLNLSFGGVDGEALILSLQDVALSSGSACSSASPEPSHVLRALGLPDERVRGSLRFGVGRFNTAEEIELVIEKIVAAVQRLRQMGSLA